MSERPQDTPEAIERLADATQYIVISAVTRLQMGTALRAYVRLLRKLKRRADARGREK